MADERVYEDGCCLECGFGEDECLCDEVDALGEDQCLLVANCVNGYNFRKTYLATDNGEDRQKAVQFLKEAHAGFCRCPALNFEVY